MKYLKAVVLLCSILIFVIIHMYIYSIYIRVSQLSYARYICVNQVLYARLGQEFVHGSTVEEWHVDWCESLIFSTIVNRLRLQVHVASVRSNEGLLDKFKVFKSYH
jgi:hypothetical protein